MEGVLFDQIRREFDNINHRLLQLYLENLDLSYGEFELFYGNKITFRDLLASSFDWEDSPEGYDFWDSFYYELDAEIDTNGIDLYEVLRKLKQYYCYTKELKYE